MVLKILDYRKLLRLLSAVGLVGAMILLYSTGSSLAESTVVNPHVFGAVGFCDRCHTDSPPKLKAGVVEICGSCHAKNISDHPVNQHPMDIRVNIVTPSPLPLSSNKTLVCSTCHDPHAGSGFRRLLRVDYQTLCIQCHSDY